MNPTITVARKNNSDRVMKAVGEISKKQVYVGIPSGTDRERRATLLGMALKAKGKKKDKLLKAASQNLTNAELMWVQSKGSPIHGIPARPVIEPAIVADGNKQAISAELGQAAKAVLAYDPSAATNYLKRAGVAGQRASQKWFTDSRNGWPQNAQSTIRRKLGTLTGKSKKGALAILNANSGPMPLVGMSESLDSINTPLIDTGALRAAITFVVKEE